ncbi:hypothetical protein [Clostridium sp. D33t1_170424_F3]|uniref:hypothetical protein n=1 Tax=Clostridium sp. D33t1_170424_F3 TaxID=2787099 RepID=UPI0018AB4367|nr:hypothetical protein [Clostridium sp. D33t1_170424_F3]
MDEIESVYCGEVYRPFLIYCERHHYKVMADLARCKFDQLAAAEGLPPRLVSRIKTMFLMYVKQHTDAFLISRKVNQAQAQKNSAPAANLEAQLRDFFEHNPDRLIRMAEVTKAVGGKVKRNDVLDVLERSAWCKVVDGTTFFYSSKEQ